MNEFLNAVLAVLLGLSVAGVVLLASVIAYYFYTRERRRVQGIARVAKHLGLEFSGWNEMDLLFECRNFKAFGLGDDEWTLNAVHGRKPFGNVSIFDYRYVLKINEAALREFRRTYACLILPQSFNHVMVRPENVLDKVSAMAGLDDINFESERFNQEYFISADNKKSAYEVVTPGIMNCLLRHKGLHMEVGGNYVLVHRKRLLSSAEFIEMYHVLEQIGEALADKGC